MDDSPIRILHVSEGKVHTFLHMEHLFRGPSPPHVQQESATTSALHTHTHNTHTHNTHIHTEHMSEIGNLSISCHGDHTGVTAELYTKIHDRKVRLGYDPPTTLLPPPHTVKHDIRFLSNDGRSEDRIRGGGLALWLGEIDRSSCMYIWRG